MNETVYAHLFKELLSKPYVNQYLQILLINRFHRYRNNYIHKTYYN